MSRQGDTDKFYELLSQLECAIGGKRLLSNCTGRLDWPKRGVYFFFENGETREKGTPRVVRVGTHALKQYSRTSLWNRLSQHRGTMGGKCAGGGNHRGSIFRLHVGSAIISRDCLEVPTWSIGNSADAKVVETEYPIEIKVSRHIGQMPFLWLDVYDEPGPKSLRGYIEKNTIALLSNFDREPRIDPTSPNWLGNHAGSAEVRLSGLWNVRHVNEKYDPRFLECLREQIVGRVAR